MTRTPEEVFDHHIHALVSRDLDELVADYADDCAVITSAGVARGKAGVRAAFTQLFDNLSDAVFDTTTKIFDGDVLFLEWVLDSPAARTEGSDTFLFGGGLIRVQTITHSAHPKPPVS
ncbi:MAG TPA: nuclear transport factor 2 family protein [Mycobacterium sp.]|nr:nuclear transport factor 2 family protein [Mycobacterium sp.]